MTHKLGVVGVGLMGKEIALNLLESGFEVMAFDKNQAVLEELREKGMKIAATGKELMESCDVILDVMNDTKGLEIVLHQPQGMIEGINGQKVLIDMTTSDPEKSVPIGKMLGEHGVEYLDCPMTGGRIGAHNRELVIMCGGTRKAFEEVKYILEKISKALFYLGPSGSGHYMKLIHNQLSHSTFLASCEANDLGVTLGIDPKAMIDVFNIGNARSYATEVRFPEFILSGTYDAGATFDTVGKDIGLVMRKANSLNFDLPITRATYDYWRHAIETGHGGDDYSTVVNLMADTYKERNL